MFGSVILEVILSLVTLYLVLSTMCSTINELISNFLQLRGRRMATWLAATLAEPLTQQAAVSTSGAAPGQAHGAIEAFSMATGIRLDKVIDASAEKLRAYRPTYISKDVFIQGVYEAMGVTSGAITVGANADETFKTLQAGVERMPDSRLKSALTYAITHANNDINQVSEQVGKWFDSEMDQLSALYKRFTQIILVVIGIILAIAFNIDTIKIVNNLIVSPTRREAIVQTARVIGPQLQPTQAGTSGQTTTGQTGTAQTGTGQTATLGDLNAQLQSLELPIGWYTADGWDTLDFKKIIGLLITAGAISLGAPFWFDVLGKVNNILQRR